MKNFLSKLWKNWGGLYLGLAYHLVLTYISENVDGEGRQLALVAFFALVYVFAFALWAPVEKETQKHIRENLESINGKTIEENKSLAKRVCELQADLGRTRDRLEALEECREFQNDEIARLQKSNSTTNKNVFKKLDKFKPLSENDQTLYFVKDISGETILATAAEILKDMANGCFFTEFAPAEDALRLYSFINYLDTLSLDGDGQCYLKNILEIFMRELIAIENKTGESLIQENFIALKILKQLNNMSYFLCAEAYKKIQQEDKEKDLV